MYSGTASSSLPLSELLAKSDNQGMRFLALLAFSWFFMHAATTKLKGPQATVIDTGSTNRPGLRVTFDQDGRALANVGGGAAASPEGAASQDIQLHADVCKQMLDQLKAVGSLSGLPARHCMKSVSFGSGLYVEYQGERSPDLSCPGQTDSRAEALQKMASKVLEDARATVKIPDRRIFEK